MELNYFSQLIVQLNYMHAPLIRIWYKYENMKNEN